LAAAAISSTPAPAETTPHVRALTSNKARASSRSSVNNNKPNESVFTSDKTVEETEASTSTSVSGSLIFCASLDSPITWISRWPLSISRRPTRME
jgi:hypothetical protein